MVTVLWGPVPLTLWKPPNGPLVSYGLMLSGSDEPLQSTVGSGTSTQSTLMFASESTSATPQPQVPGRSLAPSFGQPSLQSSTPSRSESSDGLQPLVPLEAPAVEPAAVDAA